MGSFPATAIEGIGKLKNEYQQLINHGTRNLQSIIQTNKQNGYNVPNNNPAYNINLVYLQVILRNEWIINSEYKVSQVIICR